MTAFFEEFAKSSWVVWPLLALAPVGLLIGAVALAVKDRRLRYRAGLIALLVASAASGIGVAGALASRSRGAAAAAFADTKVTATRARRAAFLEARLPLRLALGVAMIPLLGGLTGVLSTVRLRRRRGGSGGAASRRPASTQRMPMSRAGGTPDPASAALAITVSVVASGAAVVAGILLMAPPPGPPLPIESPVWGALEGVEIMEGGAIGQGCQLIEDAASKGHIEPASFPEVSSAVSSCFDMRFDEAMGREPPANIELLQALSRSPLPYSAVDRARLDREIARETNHAYSPTR